MKKLLKIYDILFDFWMRFPEKLRYLMIGGYNTVVSYGLFVVLLMYFGEEFKQRVLFVSFVISSFHSFFMQRTFVFDSKGNYKKEYVKCLFAWTIGYIMNAA